VPHAAKKVAPPLRFLAAEEKPFFHNQKWRAGDKTYFVLSNSKSMRDKPPVTI